MLRGKINRVEDLGLMLQQGRLLSGMSQRDLAEKINSSQRYVWELESGKKSVVLNRLLEALRASGVQLVAEIDDSRQER